MEKNRVPIHQYGSYLGRFLTVDRPIDVAKNSSQLRIIEPIEHLSSLWDQ
ncbi:hypothetical protein IRZ64_00940 [Limosilactobacillus oris]|nr:hypothetical protein [Limosilactobacillus oris]